MYQPVEASGTMQQVMNEPYLEITIQPAKEYRFRYQGEGESHGGITGEGSDRSRKTFPTVKIQNYSGNVTAMAQLVTISNPPKYHAHTLVGKDCRNGICQLHCIPYDASNGIRFSSLGIQHAKKKNVAKILEAMYLEDAKQNRSTLTPNEAGDLKAKIHNLAASEASNMDLSTVRIMFHAHLYDVQGKCMQTLGPVYSNPISRAKPKLKISFLKDVSGKATGGDEMCLLCDKVQKDDIMIRFYKVDEGTGDLVWDDTGRFQPHLVHHQFAIVFKTPPYKDVNIKQPVRVQVQLVRPSDDEVSQPMNFIYQPVHMADSNVISCKKRTVPQYWADHIQGPIAVAGQRNISIKPKPLPFKKDQGPQSGPLDPTQLLKNPLWQRNQKPVTLRTVQQNPNAPSTSQQALQSGMMATRKDVQAVGLPLQTTGQQIGSWVQVPNTAHSVSTFSSFQSVRSPLFTQSSAQSLGSGHPSPTYSGGPASVVMMDVNSPQAVRSPMQESSHSRTASQLSAASPNSGMMNPQASPVQNFPAHTVQYVTSPSSMSVQSSANIMGTGANESQASPEQIFTSQSRHLLAQTSAITVLNVTNSVQSTNNPPGSQDFSAQIWNMNEAAELQDIDGELLQEFLDSSQETDHSFKFLTGNFSLEQDGLSRQHAGDAGLQWGGGKIECDSVVEEQPQDSGDVGNTEDFASGMRDTHKASETTNVPEATTNVCDVRILLLDVVSKLVEALRGFQLSKDVSFRLVAESIVELQDSFGNNCLHLAVMHNLNDILHDLTKLCSLLGLGIVNDYNSFFLTSLHLAVLCKNDDAVLWLTSIGADPLLVDRNGDTAIHVACDLGVADALEILLKAAGDHEEPYSYDGLSPLHILAKKSFDDVCRCMTILIKYGYDVDAEELKGGRTPLHIAAEENNVPVARYLITECDADLTACTFDGLTPLHYAASCDHKEISIMLLAFGVDPHARYSDGESIPPISLASSEGMREILKADYSGAAADIEANPCHVLDLVKIVAGTDAQQKHTLDQTFEQRHYNEETLETVQAELGALGLAQDSGQ